MAVTSATSPTATSTSSTSTSTTSAANTGLNGLTADDFFKLLIAQLQNQDPSEPVSNQEMLQQISSMRSLQSNVELSSVLSKLSSALDAQNSDYGQKLSTAASYIGRSVTLDDGSVGTVEHAFLDNNQAYLGIDGNDIPLSRVVGVNTSETFVNRLVSATGYDANGATQTITGVVQSVSTATDGTQQLVLSTLDGTGNSSVTRVPVNTVDHIYSANGLVGKRVVIVDKEGVQHGGVASAATVKGQPGISVAGTEVSLDRVVSVN